MKKIRIGLFLLSACCLNLSAADWPMWKQDAGHSASTPMELPKKLHLQWSRELPPPQPAWEGERWLANLSIDPVYEAVIKDGILFVPSMVSDSLSAFRTEDGKYLWTFYADGPVRFAPVAWKDRVFIASDDGCVYALNAADGELVWRFNAAPRDRKILGNGRLISTWPVRGGPVLAGDTLCFAAGMWPDMGVFVYALDLESGAVRWVNEEAGMKFLRDPKAEAIAGLAPQGVCTVSGDTLLVPAGRGRPAGFDLATGQFKFLDQGRDGGSTLAANDQIFLNGSHLYLGDSGRPALGLPRGQRFDGVVLGEEHLWFPSPYGIILSIALDSLEMTPLPKPDVERFKFWKNDPKRTLQPQTFSERPAKVLLQAGDTLVAAQAAPSALLGLDAQTGSICWELELPARALSAQAADDRLFVALENGSLLCFGGKNPSNARVYSLNETKKVSSKEAQALLKASGVRAGYALVLGKADPGFLAALVQQSGLKVLCADDDAAWVDETRRQLAETGSYGDRLHLTKVPTLGNANFPPYTYELIVVKTSLSNDAQLRLLNSLRPYSGKLSGEISATLPEGFARVETKGLQLLERKFLPGAGSWTHEDGDASRKYFADDQLVKPPVGIYWFGGESGGTAGFDEVLRKHARQPRPQIAAGRMVIKGIGGLHAFDIYTGRLLWKRDLPGFTLKHHSFISFEPSSRLTGGTHVTLEDFVYVNLGETLLQLDAASGETVREIPLPEIPEGESSLYWGYTAVSGDLLIAGAQPLPPPKVKGFSKPLESAGVSRQLIVFDRFSGRKLWSRDAEYGFTHNTIVAGNGRIYCVDAPPSDNTYGFLPLTEQKRRPWSRATVISETAQLLCLDAKTGKELWHTGENIYGTRLMYSEPLDVLVQSVDSGGMPLRNKLGGELTAYRGKDGKELWSEKGPISRPYFLFGGRMIPAETSPYDKPYTAYDLLTGYNSYIPYIERTVGTQCSAFIANEHMLFYRSSTAAWCTLEPFSGTVNIPAIKPGCTENMIPAGGVVAMEAMFAANCNCQYPLQTSLALIHEPDIETWAYGTELPSTPDRLGLNFGAPGDRLSEAGTLWLDYPGQGPSPYTIEPRDRADSAGGSWDWNLRAWTQGKESPVSILPETPNTVRRHSIRMKEGCPLNWVAASQMQGLQKLTLRDLASGTYTVNLIFAELDESISSGGRVFELRLQDEPSVQNLDICKEAGGSFRTLIKTVKNVNIDGTLTLELVPIIGTPVLSGIELMLQ